MSAMDDRLYLISPPAPGPDWPDLLAAALDAGGVACVRLDIAGAEEDIRRAADAARPVCAARDVALVIAEHPLLVAPHGLDGVHLTQGGAAAVRAARAALGAERIVGAFAGASKHKGMLTAEAGADYVAFGPIDPGALGTGAPVEDDLFEWWDEAVETPSVAEGGLTPARAATLARVADFLAPRMSVWRWPDGPAGAVRAYRAALATSGG